MILVVVTWTIEQVALVVVEMTLGIVVLVVAVVSLKQAVFNKYF